MFYNFVVIQQNVNTLVVKIKDKGMKKNSQVFFGLLHVVSTCKCVIHLVDVTCVEIITLALWSSKNIEFQ